MGRPATLTYTPDEYLAAERAAALRSEYLDGRIVAMSGGSRDHSVIAAQLIRLLGNQLAGRPCEVHGSDLRVAVTDHGLYTYPDVTVICGEPQFEDAQRDTLMNPTVLVEVLSPTTEAYDRGEKFARYRQLSSLMDYVLVAQDRPRIERFTRDGDDWVLTAFDGLAATVALASIGSGDVGRCLRQGQVAGDGRGVSGLVLRAPSRGRSRPRDRATARGFRCCGRPWRGRTRGARI